MKRRLFRYLAAILAAAALTLSGCTAYYGLVETEPSLMTECDCLGTFAETANPGREDGGVIKHYVDTTGVQQRIMKRAARAGATHLVWLHTYSMAASAQAYRCPKTDAMVTAATPSDGIWEEDLN